MNQHMVNLVEKSREVGNFNNEGSGMVRKYGFVLDIYYGANHEINEGRYTITPN